LIAGVGVTALAKSFVEASSDAEVLTMRLQTLTGHGKEMFDILNAWAGRMPIDTKKAVEVFSTLIGYGLTPTLDMMTTLVDTGIALTGSTQGFERIALALGQMQVKGKVSGEELRQLAEAGYAAGQVLQREFGLSADEMDDVNKALQARGITTAQVIDTLVQDMKSKFGGMSASLEGTWKGLTERIAQLWFDIRRAVMDSGPFQLLEKQLKGN
jgi:tape measure domain-containing protein